MSTSPTTRTRTTSIGTRERGVQRSGIWAGCALDRNGAAQAGMGVAMGDVTADGHSTSSSRTSPRTLDAVSGLGQGAFEDASRDTGAQSPPTVRCPGERRSPTSITTAISTSSSRTGTSIPRSTASGGAGTYAQRKILLENTGAGARRLCDARPGPGVVRAGRSTAASPRATTTMATWTCSYADPPPPPLLRNDTAGGAG